MSYIHTGKYPVVAKNHPIDPDSTDWVVFSYGDELLENETIESHLALIVGGTITTDSTYIGDMTDKDGVEYTECYGVQFSVESSVAEVRITHRTNRAVLGVAVLSRLNLDRTVIIPVRHL